MLDTKMIIYEGNVIEMFLKSVLQFSLSNKIDLFDNETEWIWLTNPKVQQQTGFIERKVAIEIRERYL